MKSYYIKPIITIEDINLDDVICVSKIDDNLDIITTEPDEVL